MVLQVGQCTTKTNAQHAHSKITNISSGAEISASTDPPNADQDGCRLGETHLSLLVGFPQQDPYSILLPAWGCKSPSIAGPTWSNLGMDLCEICQCIRPRSLTSTAFSSLFQHHESLRNLRKSATECKLCRLLLVVLSSTNGWPAPEDQTETSFGQDLTSKDRESAAITLQKPNGCVKDIGWIPESAKDTFVHLEVKCGNNRAGLLQAFADPNHPRSVPPEIAGRRIYDPASVHSIRTVQNWLASCSNSHSCGPQQGPLEAVAKPTSSIYAATRSTPKRILDLNADGRWSAIRLIEGMNREGVYIALSHHWGESRHFTTTKSTILKHMTRIEIGSLPKTFRHAVKITRALGVRYLWIDSICIVQDDSDDWQRESAVMDLIYCCAHLTIAASSADSDDSGILDTRQKPSGKAVELEYLSEDQNVKRWWITESTTLSNRASDNIDEDVNNSALHSRAWALQERLLSPRIVHYGKHQLIWECNKYTQCENGYLCGPNLSRPGHRLSGLHGNWYKPNDWGGAEVINLSMYWRMEVLTHFSGLCLTFESDRLPSLSGLIAHLRRTTGQNCFAGIWTFRLHEGLIWFVARERDRPGPENSRGDASLPCFPSWSWASTKHIIAYPHFPQLFRSCIDRWKITESLRQGHSSTGGEMRAIILTGLASQAKIGNEDRDRTKFHQVWCMLYSKQYGGNGRVNVWRVLYDEAGNVVGSALLDKPWSSITKVVCLLVASPERDEDQRPEPPFCTAFSLLMVPRGRVNGHKRVGLAAVDLRWAAQGTASLTDWAPSFTLSSSQGTTGNLRLERMQYDVENRLR
ncbi:hypothetical protein M409DRAFT_56364 [Zasmidium cellare ATCC 36951]|uniref:Heterokaryon incompatibility domain-containing protein n=1 Tax=Zasmidium cellare ATCC 36951 TaxID=1080233 RepID=A0A6A6CCV1_ZASCE|nr:uncharacterized protein M409DRAFT_56364 [Zasmidium cellare ATCC 36951]KAF2165027.1 hypothetical protein M409DRAFT_56364 [Zasmidium cellare ATCC 36951]